MLAERPKKIGNKNKVNVQLESSQDASKNETEQSLSITKREVKVVLFHSADVYSFGNSKLITKLQFY